MPIFRNIKKGLIIQGKVVDMIFVYYKDIAVTACLYQIFVRIEIT